MPKFTFIGSNASGHVSAGGYKFETGKPVEVKDSKDNKDLLRRLGNNVEFVEGAPDAAARKKMKDAEEAAEEAGGPTFE